MCLADTAVIVHKSNDAEMSLLDVKKLFLGKQKNFPNGQTAKPLDLPREHALRISFLNEVLGKRESSLNAYWARMIFSSKGVPPRVYPSEEAVLVEVANNQQAIAYIDAAKVNDEVRVLLIYKTR